MLGQCRAARRTVEVAHRHRHDVLVPVDPHQEVVPVDHLLLTTYYLLLSTHYLLPVDPHQEVVPVDHLLLTTYYLLLTTYYL